jgi:hypothetical protein
MLQRGRRRRRRERRVLPLLRELRLEVGLPVVFMVVLQQRRRRRLLPRLLRLVRAGRGAAALDALAAAAAASAAAPAALARASSISCSTATGAAAAAEPLLCAARALAAAPAASASAPSLATAAAILGTVHVCCLWGNCGVCRDGGREQRAQRLLAGCCGTRRPYDRVAQGCEGPCGTIPHVYARLKRFSKRSTTTKSGGQKMVFTGGLRGRCCGNTRIVVEMYVLPSCRVAPLHWTHRFVVER